MPLTPEDVSNKRFTTVRLREGYDMTEVDQFLDEVEAALATMTRENDELRGKLQSAQGGEPVAAAPPAPAEPEKQDVAAETADEPAAAEPAPEPESAPQPERQPTREPVAAMETLQVTTMAEASVAATRLLELAGRNADELVLGAQEEAEQIVGDARTSAETLESEARQRAESLDHDTEERRQSVFGDIERERAELDVEIAQLRTFEREYRTQLKSYFEQQLEALDGHGEGGSLAEPLDQRSPESDRSDQSVQDDDGDDTDGDGSDEPSRLRAILGEDDDNYSS